MFNLEDLEKVLLMLLNKIDNKYISFYEMKYRSADIVIIFHLTNNKTFRLCFDLSYLTSTVNYMFNELEKAVIGNINELCIEEVVNERIKEFEIKLNKCDLVKGWNVENTQDLKYLNIYINFDNVNVKIKVKREKFSEEKVKELMKK